MTEYDKDEVPQAPRKAARWVPGLLLIAIGLVMLIDRLLPGQNPSLLLLAIGVAFLASGIASRRAGLLVPAGILLGLATGALLARVPLWGTVDETKGGIMILCLGGGFGLVTLLSALFTDTKNWWALGPGGLFAVLGGALLIGHGAIDVVGHTLEVAWPLALVAVGVALMLRVRRRQV